MGHSGVTDEVVDFLIRQQAQWVNMQYARFLSRHAASITEQEVDVLIDAIDCHCHGGSDPMERLMLEDDIGIRLQPSRGCGPWS